MDSTFRSGSGDLERHVSEAIRERGRDLISVAWRRTVVALIPLPARKSAGSSSSGCQHGSCDKTATCHFGLTQVVDLSAEAATVAPVEYIADFGPVLPGQCSCITMHCHRITDGAQLMAATQKLESTLTDRYQTTVPDTVRRALKLGKRDKIRYVVQPDGAVLMTRATPTEEDDPALGKFLDFLERDIGKHPERVRVLGTNLAARVRSLVRGVHVDLDAPLPAEDK